MSIVGNNEAILSTILDVILDNRTSKRLWHTREALFVQMGLVGLLCYKLRDLVSHVLANVNSGLINLLWVESRVHNRSDELRSLFSSKNSGVREGN